jgi:hypothetical protein
MTDLRTAAQQALKSLRGYRREINCEQPCDAERALEAALEQGMTDLRTAAQQALVAFESLFNWRVDPGRAQRCSDAITALKAALQQQEQGPVEIKPPNPEGATQCTVRWWAETPAGWVGAWDREALEQFVHPPRREPEPAAFDALVAISLLTHLGGEVADYADVVDAVRRLHAVNQELLEALQAMLRMTERHATPGLIATPGSPVALARAAIARAEGKV